MTQLQDEYSETHQERLIQVKVAFIVAGFFSFLLSVYLYFLVDERQGIYLGLWVPSIWSLAVAAMAIYGITDSKSKLRVVVRDDFDGFKSAENQPGTPV